MAVMMPRQQWTDERLDHFEKRIDDRFDVVNKRLDTMDADIRELRQSVDRLSESMRRNFIAPAMLVVAAAAFF